MSGKCRLCMMGCPLSFVEDEELRWMIDKIFYFKIFRNPGDLTLVCETCRETVAGFHEYAESVWKNQQFMRASSVPSTSGIVSKVEPDIHHIAKREHIDEDQEPPLPVAYLETSMTNAEDSMDDDDQDIDYKGDREWLLPDEDEDPIDEQEVKPTKTHKVEFEIEEMEDVEYLEEEQQRMQFATPKAKKPGPSKPTKLHESPKSEIEEQLLQHYNLCCDLCNQPLNGFAELMRHFKNIHNQPAYLNCCNKKITKKCWMIEHIQVHLNPDTFHCAICRKSYSSSRVLKEHTKEVHTPNEERSIKCETCHKPFATQRALSAHLMVSHGSIPCPECHKLLASQGSLKKHMVMMHGEGEQHVCDVCARVFRSKPCFDKHVKMHLGTFEAERVQCTLCMAWLTNKYCLRQHTRRIHTNADEVVSCEICGRAQRNQVMLRHHMTRAHGESRFECDVCFKKFKRPHHMREHKAIHHTGEDLYGCDYCPERFNNKNKQCLHRKTCHPAEFEEEMRRRAMKDM
ncbi:AAEL002279-PA [Aedes aegypti]|uniref:AAEL002279-PA n=2 Tax=Aedes aegypti TaxID=7159 RepID=A0A1S4F192_AEDAE|nr:transcription factor grauzone [Aedes aegypti]EAT46555.1 AAEL002279-PA [Aedes aegypti]